MSGPLLLSAVWVLALLGAFWYLHRAPPPATRPPGRALLTVAAVALAARLIPNLLLPVGAGYDIESYWIVGGLVLQGEEIYDSPETVDRYPYLPLQMYWSGLARWVAEAASLPFVKIARLAPIAADVGIALLLFLSLRRTCSTAVALQGGLLYSVNPVPVLVCAYHGQFDAIPALCILLALYFLRASSLSAGAWLGLGILAKSWPALALPSLLVGVGRWKGRLIPLGAAVAVPLAGIALYTSLFDADLTVLLREAVGYNRGIAIWGYTYFFRLLSVLRTDLAAPLAWLVQYGRYLTLAALSLVWLVRARKEPPAAGILTILVAFFAVTHAFAIQYLMWVVPFAILTQQHRWLRRYTLGALAYMFLAYYTLILANHVTQLLPWPQADWLIIMPAGLPAWLVVVAWATSRLVGNAQEAPQQRPRAGLL
ncbi:MAG: glycosyltransferase family 87 protein [Anaerolineae bacterium]|nr:glycosyltransferase family 87 protein [Anaerolineae bacterium]